MSRSLGLGLYALLGPSAAESPAEWPERPAGDVAWLHVPSPVSLRPMTELARRLREEDGQSIVMTGPAAPPPQPGLCHVAPPAESAAAARAFLDHWRPGIAVMAEGELRFALIAETAARGIPMVMADAEAPQPPAGRRLVWPGLVRGALGQFARIIAIDDAAGRLFRRKGAAADRVRVEGRMEEGSRVLPCTEAERAALARQFQTRPVWMAAGLPEVEDAAVIGAHRAALRMAHRLLLILVPDMPDRADALARMLAETEGWTVARRSADEEPDEETEVFLADVPSEMGLWYRLAPITFLGGSLLGAGSLRDPFEAAALGSAILHGPQSGGWTPSLARLGEARAARRVQGAADLADGLSDLLSPDRAARLAQGAWAVASAGAEVTDRVMMTVRELRGVGA